MKKGRKPHPVPTEGIRSYLPLDLVAELNLYFLDPTTDKPKYGARSALIEQLLREWLYKQRRDSVRIPSENVEPLNEK